jgi:hypothetical protein
MKLKALSSPSDASGLRSSLALLFLAARMRGAKLISAILLSQQNGLPDSEDPG